MGLALLNVNLLPNLLHRHSILPDDEGGQIVIYDIGDNGRGQSVVRLPITDNSVFRFYPDDDHILLHWLTTASAWCVLQLE